MLVVTNIIGPYRQHLFNAWAQECARQNVELHTAFMARGEPRRPWKPEDYPLNHPHVFHRGIHIPWRKHERYVSCNPGIWAKISLKRWDIVVIGGYDNITSGLAPAFMHRDQLRVFWGETNTFREGHKSDLARLVKRWLLKAYDAFLVPGRWAEDYVRTVAPEAAQKAFVFLPNLVNDNVFRACRNVGADQRLGARTRWNLSPDARVLLYVGRFSEEKGIHLFASAVRDRIPGALTILLAGDGPLRQRIQSLAEGSAHPVIRNVGWQDENGVRELLGISDGFVLPSVADCWPLALLEACMAGLPLLVSDRVGNHIDCVVPGKNGWVFDITDADSVVGAVRQFAAAGTGDLSQMAAFSARLADEKFATDRVLASVTERLVRLRESKKERRNG